MFNRKRYMKRYYRKHRKKLRKYHKKYWKKYYSKNKSKIKKRNKKWVKLNKRRRDIYLKKYRQKNMERIEKYHKQWWIKNKKRVSLYKKRYDKKYYQEHKKQIYNRTKKYTLNKLKTDLIFKLTFNLRNSFRNALKRNSKSVSITKLLGCTIPELKQYLENQFTKGMTWKNYGKWEIDHILPIAKFDLSKPEEQRKCFHYTNLQPLWAKENREKSNNFFKGITI